MDTKQKKYAETYGNIFVSMLPLIVMFIGILICAFTGNRTPRSYWSAGVFAMVVGFFIYKDKKQFSNAIINGLTNRIFATILFALYFSGIMSKIISAGQLVNGLVWLTSSLKMPAALIPTLTFIVGAIMSTATGTSMGTVTALAPLMLPLASTFGCDVGLTAGAVVSGAVFGDNLAPISDTTIASSLTQQTDVGRVVRSRAKYSVFSGIIAIVLFTVFGFARSDASVASSVVADSSAAINLVFILVPVLVVFLMVKTGNLATSLLMGDVFGIVLLFVFGRIDFAGLVGKEGLIGNGINGMVNVTVFITFIFIVSQIVKEAGALDKTIELLSKKAKTSRSAEIICNFVTTITVACIVSSSSTCALAGALNRNIMTPYHVSRDRTANMLDGLACATAGLLPYSSNILNTIGFAVSTGAALETFAPIDIIKNNYYCMILLAVFWVCAFTGIGLTYETDEMLAKEGIFIDPEASVAIPANGKISKYKYTGIDRSNENPYK